LNANNFNFDWINNNPYINFKKIVFKISSIVKQSAYLVVLPAMKKFVNGISFDYDIIRIAQANKTTRKRKKKSKTSKKKQKKKKNNHQNGCDKEEMDICSSEENGNDSDRDAMDICTSEENEHGSETDDMNTSESEENETEPETDTSESDENTYL